MAQLFYNPFDRFSFNKDTCFLSGGKSYTLLNVFPKWLSERFDLDQKPIKLLDESIVTYGSITAPASKQVEEALQGLENEISEAFTAGYEKVKQLESIKLFQWIGKLVFGMIHYEISAGMRQQQASGEPFNFSPVLTRKFSSLHFMLQSLIRPIVFEGTLPWSVKIFPVKNAPETFSYRDEINTLTFSLRMNDFGIIACLQDNGASLNYHKEILEKTGEKILHPIQFEELCGRFFYSSYLFNRLPEYTFLSLDEAVYVDSMPFYSISGKPLFDPWQVKTYGQVLENFWKPWGFTLFEIIKDPEKPMSFLLNGQGDFVSSENIELPLQ